MQTQVDRSTAAAADFFCDGDGEEAAGGVAIGGGCFVRGLTGSERV